jgi:hypothetical protein
MVLSSASPLFVLWAARGTTLIPTRWMLLTAALLVSVPNGALAVRVALARRRSDKKELIVGRVEDPKDRLLVYLFAVLLPLYAVPLDSWRNIIAALVATSFILFVFYHLHLHYLNLAFALFGYRVFTIYPPEDNNPASGRIPSVLLSRRIQILDGDRLVAYRLSNYVFLEMTA